MGHGVCTVQSCRRLRSCQRVSQRSGGRPYQTLVRKRPPTPTAPPVVEAVCPCSLPAHCAANNNPPAIFAERRAQALVRSDQHSTHQAVSANTMPHMPHDIRVSFPSLPAMCPLVLNDSAAQRVIHFKMCSETFHCACDTCLQACTQQTQMFMRTLLRSEKHARDRCVGVCMPNEKDI